MSRARKMILRASLIDAFEAARNSERNGARLAPIGRIERGYFRACFVLGFLLNLAGLDDAKAVELGIFWIDEEGS